MAQSHVDEYLEKAKEWILNAGKQIKQDMKEPYEVETKKDATDLVTEIDKKTEQYFIDQIFSVYPDHKVLGEEGMGDEVHSLDGVVWIIDPIDGTMNFVHQQRFFAISIGIYIDGIGEIGLIYDVMDDTLYEAVRGRGSYKNGERLPNIDPHKRLDDALVGINNFWAIPNRRLNEKKIHELVRKVKGTRSYGSAALEFAFIAEGIIDAYITMRLQPWDIAAGKILVEEVGGITTRVDGSELDMMTGNTVICSNRSIHQSLLTFIQQKDNG
ncbi:inositol monophosphatase [Halalkalibacillus sediminis]|uniref:inositol-phosphate phosphatase n=1 Tax=Halalkalibacillus sediminis TaxID=2018042 RepID=A0A2I0QW13_9BACI|nr:inositol monophosphatase family protein [Halalkalibacillus sediminis]PKR78489.1 inositol monophosphatase [Halalkalibacillus sediminis]